MHLFTPAAAAHPAHRAGIQIIEAHGQFQMTFGPGQFIGHVETVPGVIQPGFGPGMAGQVFAVFAVQITRDIPRRNPQAARTGDERVGVVLAHTRAPCEGLGRAGVHFGGARRVGHVLVQAVHQVDQRRAIAALLAFLFGKRAQGCVGFGQAGEAQEGQRRLALVLGFAQFVDVDLTTGADDDRFVRFVHGQHVQDVAERIELRAHRPRQVELPTEHVLALAVMGGQSQVLDARAHLIFVVIGGLVANRKSHAASR